MKELVRMVAYFTATLVMMGTVIAIAQAGVTSDALVIAAILVVVVLPVIIAVLMARREKKNAES